MHEPYQRPEQQVSHDVGGCHVDNTRCARNVAGDEVKGFFEFPCDVYYTLIKLIVVGETRDKHCGSLLPICFSNASSLQLYFPVSMLVVIDMPYHLPLIQLS